MRRSKNSRHYMYAMAPIIMACCGGPHVLFAQSASDEAGQKKNVSSTASALDLEEIVVTARRREEKLQTVPIAVTVVSQQTLQDNNIQTLGDLQYLIPSMTTNTALSRDSLRVAIRGQGSNAQASLPGVIMYINEVPIPTNFQGELASGPGLFFDLENVQVLKGPQGTLFGRNSAGGAVLLQTARPTNEFAGHVQLGYGNHNAREINGVINLPIVEEKLLTRLAFNGQWRNGFTHVLADPAHPGGFDADDRNAWSVRATTSFRPTDRFQNDTILSYQKYYGHGSPMQLRAVNPAGLVTIFFPSLPGLLEQQDALGIRGHIPVDTHLQSNGSNLLLSNITRVELSDALTFRNIFGYEEVKAVYEADFDATALPIVNIPSTPYATAARQYTEEAQVLGKSFGERLEWIAGAFYLQQPFPHDFERLTSTIFGGLNDGGSKRRDESKALFAQGTYDLSTLMSGLSVTAGLRYTWDERSAHGRGAAPGTSGAFCGEPRVNCDFVTSITTKSSALTWTASIEYQATLDTLLYLSSRRGYRGAGNNGADATSGQVLPGYDPEYVTDFELGIKSDWRVANRAVRTNAAIYYQDYTDIQVAQLVVVNGAPQNLTQNAGEARLWGGELEALMQLTDDFQLGVNFDYLNLKYTKINPGVNVALLNATRTAGRPPYKYGISARYHVPLTPAAGNVTVQANWNWQDKSGDPLASIGGLMPAFGLLNLAVNWNEIGGSPLDASIFASNLLDKDYKVGGFSVYQSFGYTADIYGDPRMYGLRLKYRFGGE